MIHLHNYSQRKEEEEMKKKVKFTDSFARFMGQRTMTINCANIVCLDKGKRMFEGSDDR